MTGRHAQVETAIGTALIDIDTAEILDHDDGATLPRVSVDGLNLPLLVAADARGSRVIAVVKRRPPLVVSNDGGLTWRETGNGLPAGRGVAISPRHPDEILYATAERVFLSENGGLFWHSLPLELLDIRAVAWVD